MTKQQLQEYKWLQKNIQQLEEKLLELETESTRMTQRISHGPMGSQRKDKMADMVSKIIDVQNCIDQQLVKAYHLMEEIEKSIEILPERERYLIRSRYINGMNWEKICEDMSYSWKQTHRIHSEALKILAG